MKICKKCGVEKDILDFEKISKNGYRNTCKKCRYLSMVKYHKLYYIMNKDELKIKKSEHYKENKESYRERQINYYNDNKEKISNYYYNNLDEMKEKSKKSYYKNKNKESNIKRKREYYRNRYNNDYNFKLKKIIRRIINSSLNKKGNKTINIIGCSFEDFKQYIESKFEPWMNWDNHGLYNGELNYGWDLDHIIPISSAKTEEELYKLNHYTNFQPLDSLVNRYIKKDKIL